MLNAALKDFLRSRMRYFEAAVAKLTATGSCLTQYLYIPVHRPSPAPTICSNHQLSFALCVIYSIVALGLLPSATLVPPCTSAQDRCDWTPGWIDEPEVTADKVSGVIVTVDAFGNLISNIDEALVAAFDEPVVEIAGHRIPMRTTYGHASPGERSSAAVPNPLRRPTCTSTMTPC